jgi:uncharacterized protein YdaT
MPWSFDRYPVSMKHLSPPVREKAIEIANALLDEGHPEGQAIRIGIARGKQWGVRKGIIEAPVDGPGGATRYPGR